MCSPLARPPCRGSPDRCHHQRRPPTDLLNHRIEALLDRYMDPIYPNWREDYDNPIVWEVVDEIPNNELWSEHQC